MTTTAVRGKMLWTPEEVAVLRADYGTVPVQEIAAKLGRTCKAVKQYARLVIEGGERRTWGWDYWTEDEEAVLTEMTHAGASLSEIAARLPNRNRVTIRMKRKYMGLLPPCSAVAVAYGLPAGVVKQPSVRILLALLDGPKVPREIPAPDGCCDTWIHNMLLSVCP